MIPQIGLEFHTPRAPFAQINLIELDYLNFLPSSTIRVYLSIASHANREGTAWPGRERIGQQTALTVEQVSRATQSLVMAGLIEKSYLDNGRVIYRLPYHQTYHPAPLPPHVNSDTPPCQFRHPEQTIESTEGTERAAPAPAPAEPTAPPPSVVLLRSEEPPAPTPPPPRILKTPPPDSIPEAWLTIGATLRPDLDGALIQASAERFLDDRRSKAIVLADWTPSWRNWIRNERGPKPVKPTTSNPVYCIEKPHPSRSWTPSKPVQFVPTETLEEAQAAFEKNLQRLGATFDPASGWTTKNTPTAPEVADSPVTSLKVSPLHGLLNGLRTPAPATPPAGRAPWQPHRPNVPTAEEVAEAEAILAAEVARRHG